MKGRGYNVADQLCWDCANAASDGCSWAREFIPVNGWTANHVPAVIYSNGLIRSATYEVKKCPEFVRDALDHGLTRKGVIA